uniref:G_PROTEIN_RECEP_F1_2 domain-containing protein n=1 Tax=Steinernema glaseri TaxID=37863 RepID=A0A1I8A090_9BILA
MGDDECHVEVTVTNAVVTVSFVVIFALSLFGNTAVVITILFRRKSSRSITNLYLLNLAVADLLRSVICMPSTLISELFHCWMLGPLFCKMAAYLQPVAVTASGYTLAIIAVERYYAICRPLESRIWHTKKHAMMMIMLVWVISFVANLGTAIMYDAVPYKDYWNCLTTNGPVADFFYQLYITLILLFIPLTIMVAMYGNVIFTLKTGIRFDAQLLTVGSLSSIDCGCGGLERKPSFSGWLLDAVQFPKKERLMSKSEIKSSCLTLEVPRSLGSSRKGSCTNSRRFTNASITGMVNGRNGSCYDLDNSFLLRSTHYEKQLIAKKRVTRMLIIIVIIFTLCWTPSYVWWLMIRTNDMFSREGSIWNHSINTFITILTYISTCTNPITYCFMNESFRKMLFSSHFCCKYLFPKRSRAFATSRVNSSAAPSPSPAARKTTYPRPADDLLLVPINNNNNNENNNVEVTISNIPAITIQHCASNNVSEAHSEQASPINANSLL